MTLSPLGAASSGPDVEAQTYAWNWFALHSGQRMQLVSFWLVATSFLGAAFVQARATNLAVIAVGVCATGAVASVAFAALDARTRRLINVAEEALRALEQRRLTSGIPPEVMLVSAAHTARTSRIASYRIIIQGLQLLVAVLFAAGGVYSVISI